MSIIQFLRIFWARRLLIGAATVSCLIGAVLVIMFVPPRYEARARVMMNILKPDTVTGQVIAGPGTKSYINTQKELIRDYGVAGRVVDELGWTSDPTLIERYNSRPDDDIRDFRRWATQFIIDRTKVEVVEGSNILEIIYTGQSPQQAQAVVDMLRRSYLASSLDYRRQDAAESADWFTAQAEKARRQLDEAEAAKTKFERENGIVLADDNIDIDSARLRALAGQAGAGGPVMSTPAAVSSGSLIQLAQLDAAINQASQNLGPNHPELQELRSRRATVASAVAQEQAANRAAAGAAAGAAAAGVNALDRAVSAQKSRVIAQRDKVERLVQLQTEVNLRREQYNKTATRAAELLQEAAIGDSGLKGLGGAVTPQDAVFPNKPLILGGALVFGLGIGVLVALLCELFGRRVRGIEDLQPIQVPVLAVIAAPEGKRTLRAALRRPARITLNRKAA
jgi:polysaccharide biosynthesis transport protein